MKSPCGERLADKLLATCNEAAEEVVSFRHIKCAEIAVLGRIVIPIVAKVLI